MCELVAELKANGYGIYLLSNASLRQHEYWPRIPASRYFDGTLVSADVKLVKPQPEIYLLLCQKFRLRPEECFFIDDSNYNIEGALNSGMSGAIFHGDMSQIRARLRVKPARICFIFHWEGRFHGSLRSFRPASRYVFQCRNGCI